MCQEINQIVKANENEVMVPNTTGTRLQQLNDDCLLGIFSMDSLSLLDLDAVSRTCKRFQTGFKHIFQRAVPKNIDITKHWDRPIGAAECYMGSKNRGSKLCDVRTVKRILENFGPKFSTMSLRWHEGEADDIIDSIAKNCSDGTLKQLELQCAEGLRDVTSKFKLIFQQLRKLGIVGCQFIDDTSSRLECDALIELDLQHSDDCMAILRNTFPNLKRFSLAASTISKIRDHTDDGDILNNFFGRHRGLQYLCLEVDPCRLGNWYDKYARFNVSAHFTTQFVFDAITLLTNLDEFVVDSFDRYLSEEDFGKIAEIVAGRPQILTLECNFDPECNSGLVDNVILESYYC